MHAGARQSVEVGLVLFYVTWDKFSVLQYVSSTEHHGTCACIFWDGPCHDYYIKPPSLCPSHDRAELKKATPADHNSGGGYGGTIKNCQKIKFYGSAIVHTVYLNMLTRESGSEHAHVACRNTKYYIRISPLSCAALRASI